MSYLRTRKKKKLEGKYTVYSHTQMGYVYFTLDELKFYSSTLPTKCKEIIEADRSMTGSEQRDIVLLCDLSMQIWGGSPNGRLPDVHIEDYFTTYYMNMVKYLKRFDPNRAGAWVSLCKFIGYDSINEYIKEYKKMDKLSKALEKFSSDLQSLFPEAYREDGDENDYGIYQDYNEQSDSDE